ncbi:MAG: dUTP diphosphatase, partial [Leptospiraceae bacterium]|nr:dUTP diphosphatase [Leptospiraceae bacterium]
LYSYCPEKIVIEPLERKFVPTGIRIALPEGYDAEVRPRSGLANQFFLIIPNSPGTIDSDYRGEILVGLMNLGKESFTVEHKMRIAQLVIRKTYHLELEEVTELSDTDRGAGGFGSTGFF